MKKPKPRYESTLMIDDNELDNFINEKVILAAHFSHKVYKCTNGKSALEFIQNLLISLDSETEHVLDVMFVDLNMPIMDGFTFIDHLLKMNNPRLKDCKIVILTSSINQQDKARADGLNDVIFLNKPLNEKVLLTI